MHVCVDHVDANLVDEVETLAAKVEFILEEGDLEGIDASQPIPHSPGHQIAGGREERVVQEDN